MRKSRKGRRLIRRFFFLSMLGLMGGFMLIWTYDQFSAALEQINVPQGSERLQTTPQLQTPTLKPNTTEAIHTETPTAQTVVELIPTNTSVPIIDGWEQIGDGLERRIFRVDPADANRISEELLLFRLDRSKFIFDVGYRPGAPLTLADWANQGDPPPVMVINGGFFTEEMIATGLTISEGVPSGTSYTAFGGMMTIEGSGPSSLIDLTWLPSQPYQPNGAYWAGLQSFPMLVLPGGTAGYVAEQDSGDFARRTAVALDRQGRIIFIFGLRGTLTLSDLSLFLTDESLGIDRALNLDGGSSTGFVLDIGTVRAESFPLGRLPTVIQVYKK